MKKKRVFAKDGGSRAKKKRIALVVPFFLFGFAALLYRCLYLHLSNDPKLERIAKSQYQTKIPEAPPRGNIYDASENELAVSVPSYSVAARPARIKDKESKEALEAKLASALKMPAKELSDKLNSEKKYVWLKKTLSPREKDVMESMEKDLNGEGVELVKGAKRYYPNREVASQILGAVGQDNEGLSGIELFYDRDLQGEAGDSTAYRDARGKMFETIDTLGKDVSEPHSLHLTLRKNIQYAAERELNETCDKYKAKSCTAIVLDPKTGAILAMASYPNFNPNEYQSYAFGLWRNIAVTDTFEPGSTFKPIMASAALERHAVGPDDKFFCENGSLQVGDHVIHDHERYGTLSVRQIIKVSSNIGIYKVGRKVGRKDYAQTVEQFGFGHKTGVDYPGEVSGYVRPVKSWQDIDFANISFGQGVRVTPLQLASAYAAMANGGVRMKPYLVSSVTDGAGKVIQKNEPEAVERVLSESTAKLITEIMKGVTEEGGTATRAALPGYTVAGKTGTAQKVVGGQYSHDKYVSSFVGIVPADDPKFVVLAMVDEPKGEIYGGLVAAPVFREIASVALADLGVPPEKPGGSPVAIAKSDPVKKTEAAKKRETTAKEKTPVAKLADLAQKTLVQAGLVAPVGLTGEGGVAPRSVPDFRGLSKRKVLAILDERKLPCQVIGSGIAQSQFPAPGSVIGKECKIVFRAD
jgi:cell division protein FtsI (penicillin-binding protein 3)